MGKPMNPKDLRETLTQLAAYYGAYHDHKETMAWNAAALQLTCFSAIIFTVTPPIKPFTAIILLIITGMTWWVSKSFINNQLKAKSIGADFAAACMKLSFLSDVQLNEISLDETKMAPTMKPSEPPESPKNPKKLHPCVPKFIFDESEIQRALDTTHDKGSQDTLGSSSSLNHKGTIRERTEAYFGIVIHIYGFICIIYIFHSQQILPGQIWQTLRTFLCDK
jgi:hypothetical protein